jgi:glycosyltransferase involved in cell wall biosynthesis
MVVLNPCHNDARVLRSARALAAAGADVRVFALGNSRYPAGVVDVDGVEVERLVVRSVLHRVLAGVRTVYLWVRGTPARLRARHRPGRGLGATPATAPAPAAPRPQRLRRVRRTKAARAAARARLRRRRARLARSRVAQAHRRGLRRTYLLLHHGLRRALLPLHRPSTIAAFWTASTEAVLAWEPDVVHAHDLNTLPAARRIADARGIPVVYDSHELWRHRNRSGRLRPISRLSDLVIERRLAPTVDAVITVSPSIAAWLERTYWLRGPVRVVRNTPERSTGAPVRGGLGRRPGEQVVAYSGRFTTGRGLEDMVRALQLLPPHVVLAAVGYGDEEYVATLRTLAERCGVSRRVRLLDPVAPQEVAGVVAGADLALVAIEPTCLSYRYSLPNKLFEAVQAGVPVVASRLPDITAVVERYRLGSQFEPGDHEALARAVQEVLAGAAPSAEDLARAADELCWEREQHELVACYRGLGIPLALPAVLAPAAANVAAVPQQRTPSVDEVALVLAGGR